MPVLLMITLSVAMGHQEACGTVAALTLTDVSHPYQLQMANAAAQLATH